MLRIDNQKSSARKMMGMPRILVWLISPLGNSSKEERGRKKRE